MDGLRKVMWLLRKEDAAAGGAGAPQWIHDAVEFARQRLDFKPDQQQEQVLRGGRRGILNCCRQWGKSTVMAAMAVHRAFTQPRSLVLVIAPTLRQSGEFLIKVEEFARRLGIKDRGDGKNRISIEFPNGSRIVGLPGNDKTIRGYSNPCLLLLDEAAWLPDEVYRTVRPMLAVGDGDLWLMSTPNGKRGFFYEECTRGTEEWVRIRVRATECERIRPEFLAAEEAKGDESYRREYLCEFQEMEGAVFSQESIEAAMEDDYEGLDLECFRKGPK